MQKTEDDLAPASKRGSCVSGSEGRSFEQGGGDTPEPTAVPAGWKLVPLEPTFAMWDAAENASMACDWHLSDGTEREHGAYEWPTFRIWHAVCAYRAMLAAAPQPGQSQPNEPQNDPQPEF